MLTKYGLRIGLLFICFCRVFFAEASINDRGYVLILNSYAESDVWANHVIDSIRMDHSIKEDICVESLNVLLEDSVEELQERTDYILENTIPYPCVLSCWGIARGQFLKICLKVFGKIFPLFFACGKIIAVPWM